MKKIFIMLLFLSSNVLCATWTYKSMHEMIEDSDIIFKGKLINTYVKKEYYHHEGRSIGDIYTTYVFSELEILKGDYTSDVIEVKKIGGCLKNSKYCLSDSTELYNYEKKDIALMYVKYNKYHKSYHSYMGDITALLVQDPMESLTTNSNKAKYIKLKQKNGEIKKEILTLKTIRDLVGSTN